MKNIPVMGASLVGAGQGMEPVMAWNQLCATHMREAMPAVGHGTNVADGDTTTTGGSTGAYWITLSYPDPPLHTTNCSIHNGAERPYCSPNTTCRPTDVNVPSSFNT
jgi:hypothetical protein